MRENLIENAIIDKVTIGREDHGILTMFLHLKGAGWGVGFGGYALDQWDEAQKRRIGYAMLAEAVLQLLDVFQVDDVQKLVGLPCRVENEGWGGRALRIGHFLEDRWFSWDVLAAEMKARDLVKA